MRWMDDGKYPSSIQENKMETKTCFECGRPAIVDHHVVPESKGGTKTVPLCDLCHAKIHGEEMLKLKALRIAALNQSRISGFRFCTKIPYGFKLDKDGKKLIPDKKEQRGLKEISRMFNEGRSYRYVAAKLFEKGFRSRTKSGKWDIRTIWHIVHRKTNPPLIRPDAACNRPRNQYGDKK
jgi:hypothetical protein